jgi:hypothetical protein
MLFSAIARRGGALMALCLPLFLVQARAAALGEGVVVGVNIINPMRASVPDQNAVLDQLQAAHVRVIRCGVSPDEKGMDFARRAAAHGIAIQIILSLQYPPDAPKRPYQPEQFPQMWGGHPLSSADPELSRRYFETLFDGFDANGITLAGVELGNEINWAAFNPEFPLPGEGKILTLEDLSRDPEGSQIAKGFAAYVKVLAVLKEVRDRSRLNRDAPIISAGLVSAPDGGKPFNDKREDMVGLAATIAFLRAHGLDRLVDAYGVHSYPSGAKPGDRAMAAQRTRRFMDVDMAECRPAGAKDGKPCWITEWGFPNKDFDCPAHDDGRARLVEEMRANFARVAAERRLAGVTIFAWNSEPWSKQPDADSVYRCGALTPSGRLAIEPIGRH